MSLVTVQRPTNIIFKVFIVLNFANVRALDPNYISERNRLIEKEEIDSFGGKLTLRNDELAANRCIMAAKTKEIDEAFQNPENFLPARNFLEVRDRIANTDVYKILRKMPKGGVFHVHSSALASVEDIVEELARDPNLYVCIVNATIRFKFLEENSIDTECSNWRSMMDLREGNESIDDVMRNYLILANHRNSSINRVWSNFESIFDVVNGIITYRPIFEKYFTKALQTMYEDNIQFVEIRSSFPSLYELDGTRYDVVQVARIYKQVSDKFAKSHPYFVGTKVIYSPCRGLSDSDIDAHIRSFKRVKAAFPDYVIGFDLVGQEDKFHTLYHFAEKLQKLGEETQFFFHAGETNWYGTRSDANLYDAILLNTKRIGHGNALLKHPELMKIVKQRKIAIEVNPISNQVLQLVKDFRNHPASYFFATDLPVVVSSDDPALWGASGLSHDFYETFVGIMSREQDLRALKQLGLNSIAYSGLNFKERIKAYAVYTQLWTKFVRELPNDPLCRNVRRLS